MRGALRGRPTRIALDTNILAYAEGVNGEERRDDALDLVRQLPQELTVIPVQVLGELFRVLTGRAGRSRGEARDALLAWSDAFSLVETSPAAMFLAADLASDHQLAVWDSVIMAVASEAGCRLLLSEDLQHGFTWGGVTAVNPFVEPTHPLLDVVLVRD